MKRLLSLLEKHGLTFLLAVLLIAALVQIGELKDEIEQLNGTVNVQLDNMRYEISSVYSNIDRMLTEANSLLSDSSHSLTGFDMDTRTASLTCTVSPKEYQPGVTEAYLLCGENEYKMRESNGVYTAELTLPLFEETTVHTVRFEENGAARTEPLDWEVDPRTEYVPFVYVKFLNGTFTGPGRDQNGSIISPRTYNGELSIRIERADHPAVGVQSIRLIEYMNGVEINRTDIPLNTVRRSDDPDVQYSTPVGTAAENPSQFYYTLQKSVDLTDGCTYEMYLEVIDDYNLHHRVRLDLYEDGKDFTPVSAYDTDIYDANGNLLYGGTQ